MQRLAKWVINLGLGLILLFAIFALILPSAFSARIAIVRSDSMSPVMPAGSLAVMSPIDPATVKVGDIITFEAPMNADVTVSHRVMEVRSGGFVTKGDASEDFDPFIIPHEDVLGRVSWHISYLGYALNSVKNFVSTIWGLILMVVLPTAIIFASAVSDFYFSHSPAKRRARLIKRREERMRRRAHRTWPLGRLA